VPDCTVSPPVLLRPGAAPGEARERVVGRVEVDAGDGGTETPRSPGTKHRHYAPAAQVRLVDDPSEVEQGAGAGYIGLDALPDEAAVRARHVVPDVETYAHDLFSFFRRCDRDGCPVIYAQRVPRAGLGRALADRLERAAAR